MDAQNRFFLLEKSCSNPLFWGFHVGSTQDVIFAGYDDSFVSRFSPWRQVMTSKLSLGESPEAYQVEVEWMSTANLRHLIWFH